MKMDKALNKWRRTALILMTALMTTVMASALALAETVDIPVYAWIEGQEADFEITESLTMKRTGDSESLISGSITVTNKKTDGTCLDISQIDVVPAAGWNLSPWETDFSMVHDGRQLAMMTEDHDFCDGGYDADLRVEAGESVVLEIVSKMGTFSQDIYEQAAFVTVTVNWAGEEY